MLLTKLVLVKIKQALHIVIFCWCSLFSAEAVAVSNKIEAAALQVADSLKIDQSYITPRTFDNLKEKYKDEAFIYERNKKNSGWWSRFKTWLNDFWYSLFDFKNKGQASKVTDWAIKIAAVVIALLVLYFIFKAVINKEGRWVFGKSSDKAIIPVTDIENNIHETNFKQLIDKAEKDHNYRLAIRYYYLWLLKQLTNAEIIEYDVEKTNSDYQNEIATPNLKQQFSYTSYLYNYIWYGEFEVNSIEFNKAKTAFHNFINSVDL